MADEVPQSPENTAENRSAPRDGTPYDGGSPGPWARPADRGPADTVPSSGSPAWSAAPKVPLDKPASGTGSEDPAPPVAHRPDPNPWAPPADDTGFSGPAATSAPFLHDRQTVTSLPADPPPPAWADPFAPPPPPVAPSEPVNPFAPPGVAVPYPQGAAVPPPPIAPDGPGRVPYGYPGSPAGYGGHVPAPQAFPSGYHGWPGMQPMPSNGMGTAGLVLGIVSAIGFCVWPLAIVLGVLGVIFGGIGRAKAGRGEASNPGQALAGIICGSVGVVLALVIIAFQISMSS
ncbi:hypothetical protein [Streptomyces sp. NPDC058964]|uniref:DUF4190 domain-containing protein n=1 Tax=Streptomyces sp. NPDC058964 TaxID=3346681 RepID=UPI0036A347FF